MGSQSMGQRELGNEAGNFNRSSDRDLVSLGKQGMGRANEDEDALKCGQNSGKAL